MIRRIVLSLGAAVAAITVALAFADVTFVLRSGERASGQLAYHVGVGDLGVASNGRERMFPFDDIALIQFAGGDPSRDELNQLPTAGNPPERERHMLVLKSGEVIHGKYHGFEGDRMTFDVWNSSGSVDRRTFNLSDVARLYFRGSDSRSLYSSILNANTPAPPARRADLGGQRLDSGGVEIRVDAARAWTDTGLIVNQGDQVKFTASDTIKIDPRISAGPDGATGMANRRSYPIPDMPAGGLIGRVGNSAAFAVGSRTSAITMPATGRLYLGINDDRFNDNSGAFTVRILR